MSFEISPAVGFPQLLGMLAIRTTWGLKVPASMYVCVTMCSLEIRVPLLSPKSQVKLISALLRYWLGSWMLTVKPIAWFWMKFWSFWFTSLIWARDMVNGTWSNDGAKNKELSWWELWKERNTGSFPSNRSLETVSVVTCDGEDCRGISEGDKPVSATAVIDDDFHVVGAQGNVVCTNGEWRGRSICHLPVTP